MHYVQFSIIKCYFYTKNEIYRRGYTSYSYSFIHLLCIKHSKLGSYRRTLNGVGQLHMFLRNRTAPVFNAYMCTLNQCRYGSHEIRFIVVVLGSTYLYLIGLSLWLCMFERNSILSVSVYNTQ